MHIGVKMHLLKVAVGKFKWQIDGLIVGLKKLKQNLSKTATKNSKKNRTNQLKLLPMLSLSLNSPKSSIR